MGTYISKRILLFIPTLIMVTLLVFVIVRLIPGDPALMLLFGDGDGQFTQEELDNLRKKLGTDKPIYEQYGLWVWNMLHLDFGKSYRSEAPIAGDLKDKFAVTFELTILAVLMAVVVAVPLGVISAIKQDTLIDYVARIITLAGIALPTFWVGILTVYLLVRLFHWLPPLEYVQIWEDPAKNLQQLIFPAITLGALLMAFIARVTRSAMLEVFREDYIRTARAKGLAEQVIIVRHALKNALLPVITVSGYQFGVLIGGTVVTEVIFLVPGMGRFMIDAISSRDYAIVQAVIVVIVVVVLVVNLLMDLVYGWLNPRIRYT